jgi:hypothetical protein
MSERDSVETGTSDAAKKQIETYRTLAEKHTVSFDEDPLDWWRKYQSTCPDLALLARSYLAQQATSCASERLFSKAGYIVNKYRTSLKSDNISMLVFLATNTL